MTAPFNARRHKRKPHINITSLIDVMFLLLIFFMLTSTFRQQLGVDISLPEAETASETEVEFHEIAVSEDGAFYFGSRGVDDAGLREAVRTLMEENPEAKIVLRADANADFGRVIRAIDIARGVGGTQLIIPTKYSSESPE